MHQKLVSETPLKTTIPQLTNAINTINIYYKKLIIKNFNPPTPPKKIKRYTHLSQMLQHFKIMLLFSVTKNLTVNISLSSNHALHLKHFKVQTGK